MKKYLILNIFFTICFLSTAVFSQQLTEISAEKKAVIAEIIAFTKAEVQTKEIMQAMFNQMDDMYPGIIDSLVKQRDDLSESEKLQYKKDLIEKNADFNKRFNQKFIEMINFQDYMNEVFYPLYDKFFTTEELKDLLTFYRTPTGQKFNSITPQLSAESIRLAQNYLLPRLDGLMKEMMDELSRNSGTNKNPPAPRKDQK